MKAFLLILPTTTKNLKMLYLSNIFFIALSPISTFCESHNPPKSSTGLGEEGKFRKFDIVTDYSDHLHYIKNNNKNRNATNCFTNSGCKVYKRIMREWKILEKHLPQSIYVRVYQDRIDLLRAVIIGAQGTPYHDGLFFFDIAFPSDYPAHPPQVIYHSHGLRLNPNLYKNGFVCLSLLNTWYGKDNEKWNPSKSTILQVLVSIQGLVLNEKPYFNEPGIKPASSWEVYNEDIFKLSCKTMLFVLRNPPKNFEAFVAAHFHERACSVLRACKAYTNGYAIIGLFSDGVLSNTNSIQVSKSFKDEMDKLYPSLFVAFARNAASLQNLYQDGWKEIMTPKPIKKKNCDIWHKLYSRIKMCILNT